MSLISSVVNPNHFFRASLTWLITRLMTHWLIWLVRQAFSWKLVKMRKMCPKIKYNFMDRQKFCVFFFLIQIKRTYYAPWTFWMTALKSLHHQVCDYSISIHVCVSLSQSFLYFMIPLMSYLSSDCWSQNNKTFKKVNSN